MSFDRLERSLQKLHAQRDTNVIAALAALHEVQHACVAVWGPDVDLHEWTLEETKEMLKKQAKKGPQHYTHSAAVHGYEAAKQALHHVKSAKRSVPSRVLQSVGLRQA